MLFVYARDEGGAVITIELNNKRRDRHDIVAEILKTAREGRIKTHIMYKAKLSYSQINAYLQLLVDKGFLENNTVMRKRQSITLYKTTPKGVYFIENIDTVNQMLG
jgi:predicted transcriptional regulator